MLVTTDDHAAANVVR